MSPKEKRTGILIILDGFGVNAETRFNAVTRAKTPCLSALKQNYPYGEIQASESFVGLPHGFMGNSEVGHLNLGAGRVVYQDFSLISKAIDDGSFFKNPALLGLMQKVKKGGPRAALHLMGLLSDGGVHSHDSHLLALIQLAKREGISRVWIHPFMDGRDTSPVSGLGYLQKLTGYCADAGLGQVATICGRFYAMDRDKRWERVEAAYQAVVAGESAAKFKDPAAYVRGCYEKNVTDEFLPPAVYADYPGISDGDGVFFFNFRADRARELSRAMTQTEFDGFKRPAFPTLCGFVGMTPYDESLGLISAFEKPKVPMTLGEVISKQGWKQLRIAETEKYAHVTYFFNGGDEKVFEGEKRVLIPSPREVRTYDLKPEMSAVEITEALLKELNTEPLGFVVINFANCDMVGHTGNLNAATRAVEVVDQCLAKIVAWVEAHDAFALLTADHGNCEKMVDDSGLPLTSHTLFPVPLYIIDPLNKKWTVKSGSLCDIAPTMLKVWGIAKPKEMTGEALIS